MLGDDGRGWHHEWSWNAPGGARSVGRPPSNLSGLRGGPGNLVGALLDRKVTRGEWMAVSGMTT